VIASSIALAIGSGMALLDIVVTVTAVTTPSTLFFLLLATVPLFGIYVAMYTLSRRVPWLE
ncbi:hypothetical protein, partial [Citrobacter youngae]|uniref:hypothetical protein n=1 Tax=Citrobacter youngae TaxID=133448 RepID=UPI001954032D